MPDLIGGDKRPIHILQVVGRMDYGGTETWLMHVLRRIDRERFRMDLLVHTAERSAFDDEARALGSRVIPCLHPRRPWAYARNFKRVVRAYGPYDVVHSHVHHYSGYVLRLAHQMGVPVRIAHGHTSAAGLGDTTGLLRRVYLGLTRQWINRYATSGLACSGLAAVALFGERWTSDPRWRVVVSGIDLTPFKAPADPSAVRAALGITPGVFVVGHVGRFVEAKNHVYLLEVAAQVVERDPQVHFLLVGDGPLRHEMESRARMLNLSRNVIFTGATSRVPALMLGAMDAFVLPSIAEGLPLVLLEAQAAGLPCVFSDAVPQEAEVVKPLLRRLSLSRPPSAWAEAILALRDASPCISQPEAVAIMEESPFNICTSVKTMEGIYSV